MNRSLVLIAIATSFAFTSCGGSLSLCDCVGLRVKYDSYQDAAKAIGEENLKKCEDSMKKSTETELKACMN